MEGPRAPAPLPPPRPYFWTKLRPEGPKKFFLKTGPPLISGSGWPPPPPTPYPEGVDPPLPQKSKASLERQRYSKCNYRTSLNFRRLLRVVFCKQRLNKPAVNAVQWGHYPKTRWWFSLVDCPKFYIFIYNYDGEILAGLSFDWSAARIPGISPCAQKFGG